MYGALLDRELAEATCSTIGPNALAAMRGRLEDKVHSVQIRQSKPNKAKRRKGRGRAWRCPRWSTTTTTRDVRTVYMLFSILRNLFSSTVTDEN